MAKSHSERSSSSSSSSKRDREHKRKRSKDGGAASSADESVASTSSSSTKKKHRKHRISTAASSDGESSGAESSSSAGSSLSASSSSSSKKKKSSSKKHSSSQSRPSSSLVSAPLASAFEVQYPILTLSIPPIHAHQPLVAVGELLDSLVMRFVPALNGVLVSHGQSYFLVEDNERSKSKSSALIDGDGAFATVRTAVECCVWRPRVGMKLRGAISLEAPSHVSVLVHATFNASIPSSHMGSEWHFVHRSQTNEGEEEVEDGVGAAGFWEHKATKKRLGPHVDFVVIGLTILANAGGGHTLALCGSLLDRPFSLPPPSTAQQGFGSAAIGTGSTAARATRMGFGDFAAGDNGESSKQKGAIAAATRRVRWEGEESSDDEDDYEKGGAEAVSKPATIKKAKGSHVKF